MSEYTYSDISKMIDHALLRPSLTVEEMEQGLELALEYDVASVCILPYYLPRCAAKLERSTVLPSTVIGFPHGGQSAQIKLAEAKRALDDGAAEIDVVINISRAVSGDMDYVEDELGPMVQAAHDAGQRIKVIFETCYLDEACKISLCRMSSRLGADWVKTSTGFGTSGATVADVALMRANSSPEVEVKASGGIRTLDDLLALRAAGASRIGASGTDVILDECRRRIAE